MAAVEEETESEAIAAAAKEATQINVEQRVVPAEKLSEMVEKALDDGGGPFRLQFGDGSESLSIHERRDIDGDGVEVDVHFSLKGRRFIDTPLRGRLQSARISQNPGCQNERNSDEQTRKPAGIRQMGRPVPVFPFDYFRCAGRHVKVQVRSSLAQTAAESLEARRRRRIGDRQGR